MDSKQKIRRAIPRWLARFTFAVGLFNILANSLRPFKAPTRTLDHYFLVYVNSTAFATAVITGFALISLSTGLRRKKRRAWNLAIFFAAINMLTDLFRFHRHPVQLALSVLLLITLAIYKEEFYAKSDPSTRWRPVLALAIYIPAIILTGFAVIYFRHSDELIGSPSFIQVLQTVIYGLVGVSGPVRFASDRATDSVYFTLATFGFFALIIPVALYLRRVKENPTDTEADLDAIQEILIKDKFADSLSYFATRADKHIIWSANRKAGLAYRVENGVALVSGDPFGEYSLWPEVIDEFLAHADQYAWTPAVIGCTERAGEIFIKKIDAIALDLGDEAIINVPEFTLEGRPIKNVREMVNKMVRAGYTTSTLQVCDLDEQERAELLQKAREWRYGAPERGFSMALDRFLDPRDSGSIITVARKDGEIEAFLSFVPWGANKLSLDRMQRSRECETGINELLIARSIEFAKQSSITEISLNFAAFKSVFERADRISAGPVMRAKRNFLRFISQWFQVESLYRFNAKFQPEWRTRYFLIPSLSQMIPVAIAAAKAEKFIGTRRNHAISRQRVS